MARVVSALQGTGKTFFFKMHEASGRVLDCESNDFFYMEAGGNTVLNPDFPANYIEYISRKLGELGAQGIVLVSSHPEVISTLINQGHDLTLIYPQVDLKDEYMQRFRDRGVANHFLGVVDANWQDWHARMANQEGVAHIELGPGQYISDVLELPELT